MHLKHVFTKDGKVTFRAICFSLLPSNSNQLYGMVFRNWFIKHEIYLYSMDMPTQKSCTCNLNPRIKLGARKSHVYLWGFNILVM